MEKRFVFSFSLLTLFFLSVVEQNTLNENIFTEYCHFQHHRHYTAEKLDSQQSLKTPAFKLSPKWLLRSQDHHKRIYIPAFRCWHHLYGKWWSKTQKVPSNERGELTCYINRQKNFAKVMSWHYARHLVCKMWEKIFTVIVIQRERINNYLTSGTL